MISKCMPLSLSFFVLYFHIANRKTCFLFQISRNSEDSWVAATEEPVRVMQDWLEGFYRVSLRQNLQIISALFSHFAILH